MGGADEVGVQHIENTGPRGAGEKRKRRDAECDGGQDQVPEGPVAIAEARQPVQLQGEDIHHQETQPELRH